VDGVKLLLKHRASLVAPNQDGNTAIEVARLNEHDEVVALLEKAQPPKGLGAGLAPSKKK
jgi:ankyrin repeat protein